MQQLPRASSSLPTSREPSSPVSAATAGRSHARGRKRTLARTVTRWSAALGFSAACWLTTHDARADLELGADLDVVHSLEGARSESGGGIALRLGRRVRLPGLLVAAELKGGLDTYGGDRSTSVYTGLAGMRLGVGELFRSSIFGHLGVGQVNRDRYLSEPARNQLGLAGDIGVAFELTLLPLIDLGVHAAYGGVPSANFDAVRAGIHATLVL